MAARSADPDGDAPGRFRCPDCRPWVTRGQSGVEYGHARGRKAGEERCPRRPEPEAVDPCGSSLDHDGLFS